MKSAKLIVFFSMATSLILVACGNPAIGSPAPSSTAPLPTETKAPQSASSSPESSATVSSVTTTPALCSPDVKDYCVVDAYFIFQLPIVPPGTDTIDHFYPYGGTEGGTRDPHHGVEFYNASGTPVLAATDGTVYFAGNDKSKLFSPWLNFYGNLIILKHDFPGTSFGTLYTLYAHLSKEEVSTGQTVTAGQMIGEVGASGSAEGSHLHFEVRVDPNVYSSTLNPELLLAPHPGNGTLAIAAKDSSGKTVFPPFNVQSYPNRNDPAAKAFQVDSYAPDTVNPSDPWGEIAALGDQPAGWYRITFLWAGDWIERWAEIQPGKLTRVTFMVK